ncbi:nucleic-acid-binding protein from transposon X-element [Trichonephila clavipes]|nr:nucleic-acid-binding protein from transposon X-element [Trichonephila clavipes]
MDFSPTRQSKVAACEKLRDTVHSISAMHSSISEGASTPTKKNSFLELYQMTSYDLAKKKDELDSNVSESTLDKTNHNVKKKKQNKKRKNRTKESSEEFIFPKKTARPVSPISTQDPIETKNNFSDLEQDVEHPLPTNENVISETITPPTKPPYPVMLKIKDNFRDQMKLIINKFPNLRNRIVGDVVKMFSNDHEERRSLIQFLKTDIDFEFYVIDVKKDKPIKAVIKGLPNSSKTDDITSDLADVGFKIESCTQLTSKRTKKPLPIFLIILPRNAHNSKIFDLTHLSYLQVRVEGYLVRGITQCFNCNNFYHTAANCHMQPRCLKCGKNHATRNCLIKERQENPFCINCQDYGHSACYTKCPKSPAEKGTPFGDPKKKRNFASKWIKEGISFANVVSGEVPNQIPIDDKKEDSPHGFLSQDSNNTSDLTQVLELFQIISNLVKKNPKVLNLLTKFKKANSDEEKTCLLAEAIMDKV